MIKKILIAVGVLIVIGVAAASGYSYWLQRAERIPDGIVWGNGRIEADDIDITPKFAGRVAELLVDEGDMVKAGQVVARMDTRDLEANLRKAEAGVGQALQSLAESRASIEQLETQVTLAKQEFERTRTLLERGFATQELFDRRRQQVDNSQAMLRAATARKGEAEHALTAARQDVDYYKINIAEGTLVAPRNARVQYRLVSVGEVIGAGARVMTLLDLSNVYMTMFLPTVDAGKAVVGAEARIVLDAYPKLVVPAQVSFIATKSQFTPKTVETRTERDKLMFRVKVRIPPDLLARHEANVRTGLPGIAYVRTDPRVDWPASLTPNVP